MRIAAIFKSAFFVFIVFFSLLFVKTPTFAQVQVQPQTVPINSYAAPNTNPDVPNNLHNWTQNVMIEVMSAMTCQLAGVDPTNSSSKCLGVDQKTGKIGFVENGGGAIGLMGGLISMTLAPPIHTGDYISYISESFGISKYSYAEGEKSGIDSLQPIVGIWKVFRDIVYLLFVIIFVIIGLAIMLRVKIDPRTVMTIQNQIPKIIIGVLLVTFSFAIAGFLIDIMWIMIYLFINIITSADPKMGADTAGRISANLNDTALGFANSNDVFNGGLLGVAGGGASSVAHIILNLFTGGNNVAQNASILDIFTNLVGALLGLLIGGIAGGLAFIIIAIALLWSMFKLWFALLEAYIMILVGVIFAPFWIVTGLLPGAQSMGFGAWLREMLGNIAAFPAAIAMFLLGRVLIDAFGSGYIAGQFNPPLIGNPAASGTNTFGAIIALGIILTTPHVVKMTKAAFKSPKIDLGPIGQAVGAGQAVVGGFAGGATGALFKKDQYGNPMGPGAVFMSKRITHPAAKFLLGMQYKNPQEIKDELEKKAKPSSPPKPTTTFSSGGSTTSTS